MSAALSVDGRPTEAAVTARDLYERHGQRVFSFCMSRLRNPEEAQDAAQTTFMYVLTALKRGVVPRNELAWLLTIAENVCRASRRTLVRRNAHVANADVDELETAALSVSHETREEIRRLRLALELLPESQRRAILLREWQGLSYADIAEQLDLSLAAVETLLFRARKGLGRYVDRSRARFGALNAASLISVARSLVSGGTGKVAVGVAGLAIAVGPAAERDLAATTKAPPPAMTSAAASRAAPIRSAPRARPRPRAGRARPAAAIPARTARVAPARAQRVPAPKPTVDTPAEAPEPKAETAGAVDLTPATPDVVTTAAAVALPLAESVQTALEPVLR